MRILPLLCLLALPGAAPACIWDSDTIASEKARFPGMEEVMFGKFPRHSQEFHEWRKKRSEEAIAGDPANLAAYDDFAVSQHKLGDHAGAIATMKKKDAIKPGLYETYSNTGTFLIYTGDLKGALAQIDKALKVNPNAHFGREKYQKWLIEWVMVDMPNGPKTDDPTQRTPGFAAFILEKQPGAGGKIFPEPLRREAIGAVLGMMRFADFDNPLLQEALGDLLVAGTIDKNASRHAAVAYIHALSRTQDEDAKPRLAAKFEEAVSLLEKDNTAEYFTGVLQKVLKEGKAIAEAVRMREVAWIKEGKDASAEFTKTYLIP